MICNKYKYAEIASSIIGCAMTVQKIFSIFGWWRHQPLEKYKRKKY